MVFLVLAVLLLAGCGWKGGEQATASPAEDSLFHSRALAALTDSIRLHPDSARLFVARGGVLYAMEQYALAERDLRHAVTLDSTRAEAFAGWGEALLALGRLQEAEQAYRHVLALQPRARRPRLQLGYVLFQQRAYPAVVSQMDTLLGIDPRLAEAYGLQSQAYQALGDSSRALAGMQKAVELSPLNYDALMALADLLAGERRREALDYYRRAAAVDTTQGEPYYGMGLYYQRRGESDSAIEAFGRCIRTDAYHTDAYLQLGQLYEDKNNWKKAREVFTLAISVSPADAAAYYHRGRCNEKLKHPEEARADYQQALNLDKDNRPAQEGLDRLGKLPQNTQKPI